MEVKDGSLAMRDGQEAALLPGSGTDLSASNQGKEAAKDIAFGSFAGVIGKYVEYPFDTVKVRLQSQPSHLPLRYTGPLDCFRQSIRQDGVLGLYRGISAPLVGAALETSSLFFSYRLAQDLLQATFLPASQGPLSLSALVACGAMSGAFTSLLLTPIELIKCKMQVPASSNHVRRPGPIHLIGSIYRHQGITGFWHGQTGTLIREMGGSAAWFGSYESVCAFFRSYRTPASPADLAVAEKDTHLPVHQQMLAGAVAGMAYNFMFYPADTIKSRMQTEDHENKTSSPNSKTAVQSQKKSFAATGAELWRQHGIRGMYRGCGITVFRAAPSSALIFSVYEALRRNFG